MPGRDVIVEPDLRCRDKNLSLVNKSIFIYVTRSSDDLLVFTAQFQD